MLWFKSSSIFNIYLRIEENVYMFSFSMMIFFVLSGIDHIVVGKAVKIVTADDDVVDNLNVKHLASLNHLFGEFDILFAWTWIS